MLKKSVIALMAAVMVMALVSTAGAHPLVEEYEGQVDEMDVMDLQMDRDMGEDYLVLDVRTPEERSEGYIPDTVYTNFGTLFFNIEEYVEDQDEMFVVSCQSGARSLIAAKLLQDMGYENVINLEGGFLAWEDAGYEVEHPEE
ncbi:rhodanese-like domain-containing protein [Halarsenatibacter silvermanii]|uniref:Rhodanese-related sulfurtransferase n=1 Tax=Halarsenatibacter silvermanii TaxID=321763 RepID=A0A1G9T7J4_9FIRM|nr:rhodanese-like domain-containing protein [Halarsenatibacter silvermanii]SDM43616.1 Rhodanese-related sulfurtransferase [Halarsenatibacter silvermanii]